MTKKLTLMFAAAIFLLFRCEKVPGTGGQAKISIQVINGDFNAGECTVQCLYGGTEFLSASANYNETKTSDFKGLAEFPNLKRGDYYFYAFATIDDTLREGGVHGIIESKKGETHYVIDFAEENPF